MNTFGLVHSVYQLTWDGVCSGDTISLSFERSFSYGNNRRDVGCQLGEKWDTDSRSYPTTNVSHQFRILSKRLYYRKGMLPKVKINLPVRTPNPCHVRPCREDTTSSIRGHQRQHWPPYVQVPSSRLRYSCTWYWRSKSVDKYINMSNQCR